MANVLYAGSEIKENEYLTSNNGKYRLSVNPYGVLITDTETTFVKWNSYHEKNFTKIKYGLDSPRFGINKTSDGLYKAEFTHKIDLFFIQYRNDWWRPLIQNQKNNIAYLELNNDGILNIYEYTDAQQTSTKMVWSSEKQGISFFDKNGKSVFTSQDTTWNQVDVVFCAANANISKSYNIASDKEVMISKIMVNQPPANAEAICPSTSFNNSNSTLYAHSGNVDTYILVLMR